MSLTYADKDRLLALARRPEGVTSWQGYRGIGGEQRGDVTQKDVQHFLAANAEKHVKKGKRAPIYKNELPLFAQQEATTTTS